MAAGNQATSRGIAPLVDCILRLCPDALGVQLKVQPVQLKGWPPPKRLAQDAERDSIGRRIANLNSTLRGNL